MDAARKSYEVQAQVRRNAEEFKNAMNDLFTWQKDIKDQEKQMLQAQLKEDFIKNEDEIMIPIRGQKPKQQKSATVKQKTSTKSILNVQKLTKQLADEKCDAFIEKYAAGDAVTIMDDTIDLKRQQANEIKDKGNTQVKLGAYQLAADEYTKAIDLYDQEAVFFTNRAFCYLKMEKYNECISDCDRAIELDNLAVKAYYRRMLANESLYNNMDALKDCTTILTIDPKNTEAKRSLERINDRIRENASPTGAPNFSSLRPNMIDILPIEKPPYMRSNTPLKRIPITDVIGPKESKNVENLKISDEDLEKLFNSNCGTFEEVKKCNNNNLQTSDNIFSETTISNNNNNNNNNNKAPLTENILNINKKKPKTEAIAATPDVATVQTVQVIENATNNKIKKIATKSPGTQDVSYAKKELRPLPPLPTSTAQFYCNWKDLPTFQKYEYFKIIPLAQLNKILGAGFDSDTLSDIINILHEFETDVKTIANTLMELSKHRHLSILILLMSNEERQVITEIINRLKDDPSCIDDTVIERINNNFLLK